MLCFLLPLLLTAGTLDPAFDKIPFDAWLKEQSRSPIHWTVTTAHPELSFHQRLFSRIEIEVDGRDLDSRRSHGELVTFFQLTDHEGTRYQGHGVIQLDKLDENIKAATVQSAQQVFLLPGDYQLAVALLDRGTGEHTVSQTKFRVAAPANPFLLAAWRNLPAVEFVHDRESPDSWYLPDIQGRLEWFAGRVSSTPLNVILNLAASVPGSSGLPALLPTLKVLSQTGSNELPEHLELLDLARHRSAFEDNLPHPAYDLNWPALKSSLAASNSASIDVHSLADRHQDAHFFVTQIRRVLRASEKPSVLVILTPPIAFESGEDLTPISLESLPPCRVFYIRYAAPSPRIANPDTRMGRRGRGMSMGMGRPPLDTIPIPVHIVDQLEATLKPLNPKVFDVGTAQEMNKALAEIQKVLGN